MRALLIVDDNVELASLLAVVAEVHGFVPRVAHTGRQALAMIVSERPVAALVDLLLPDLPGQDLLRELHARGVITFAMSGVFRGEHFARTAVETYGARAYFEKPFAARDAMLRLVALVDEAEPAKSPPPAPPDEPETAPGTGAVPATAAERDEPLGFDEDTSPGAAVPAAATPSLDAMDAAETTGIFATSTLPPPPPESVLPEERDLLEEVEPEAQAEPPPVVPTPGEPDVAAPLPFSGRDVWGTSPREPAAAPTVDKPGPGAPVHVAPGAIARLLADLGWRRASGEVRFKKAEVVKVVGLHEGRVVFAASNLGSERLSRFALKAGRVPAHRIEAFQEELKKGTRTLDALLCLGILGEADRAELVSALVREIVWSLLDVSEGEAQVNTAAPARKGLLLLSLPVAPLLLEGYRRSFTLLRLRELVDSEKRYLQATGAGFAPADLGLVSGEKDLWAAADGSKTVEDLVLLSELGEREALSVLVGLTHLGALQMRAPAARRIMLV